MVVVGMSSAITSIPALWSGAPSNCRYIKFGAGPAPARRFAAVQQQHKARAQSYLCRGCKRAAASTLGMLQGFGNLSLASPSPSRALPVSFGISDSRIVSRELGPSQCVARINRKLTGRNDLSALLQQRWECQCQSEVVGKSVNGRRISALAQSYSSGAKASSVSQEEAYAEAIDPGLLARVAKVYRPAVILPGLGNNSGDYDVLVQSLEALEVASTVVKVARIDWLRNAAGLLDGDYWRGKLRPRPVLDWYLDRVKTAIKFAKAGAADDQKVSLIGHSAGGWLARVYMAEFGTEDIALLLTLGTPHLPPPRGVPGVFDQTRGLLYHVEENCPGAYHAPHVKYVCVAGRCVKGSGGLLEDQSTPVVTGTGTLDMEGVTSLDNKIEEDLLSAVSGNDNCQAENLVNEVVIAGAQPEAVTKSRPTFRDRIIGAGYKQVCGRADVWGDGVVPEESAYLEGAVNIRLDGSVYHSPVGADDLERPWYGSAGKIDQWVHHLLDNE